jgi:hypothetical protein
VAYYSDIAAHVADYYEAQVGSLAHRVDAAREEAVRVKDGFESLKEVAGAECARLADGSPYVRMDDGCVRLGVHVDVSAGCFLNPEGKLMWVAERRHLVYTARFVTDSSVEIEFKNGNTEHWKMDGVAANEAAVRILEHLSGTLAYLRVSGETRNVH